MREKGGLEIIRLSSPLCMQKSGGGGRVNSPYSMKEELTSFFNVSSSLSLSYLACAYDLLLPVLLLLLQHSLVLDPLSLSRTSSFKEGLRISPLSGISVG